MIAKRLKNVINETRLAVKRLLLKLKYREHIKVGVDFRVRKRFNCLIKRGGVLVIGDRVSFNNDCSVNVLGKVSIGDNVLFGENVKIYDHNHRFRKEDGIFSEQEIKVGSVTIGDNCWIASGVTLLEGAQIGNNCVIGAGCVINCSIPEWTLVQSGGNLTMVKIH